MLEVKFILLITVFPVPPTQQSPFLYVYRLAVYMFVKYTFIYIIQLYFSTLLQIIFASIFFVILAFP